MTSQTADQGTESTQATPVSTSPQSTPDSTSSDVQTSANASTDETSSTTTSENVSTSTAEPQRTSSNPTTTAEETQSESEGTSVNKDEQTTSEAHEEETELISTTENASQETAHTPTESPSSAGSSVTTSPSVTGIPAASPVTGTSNPPQGTASGTSAISTDAKGIVVGGKPTTGTAVVGSPSVATSDAGGVDSGTASATSSPGTSTTGNPSADSSASGSPNGGTATSDNSNTGTVPSGSSATGVPSGGTEATETETSPSGRPTADSSAHLPPAETATPGTPPTGTSSGSPASSTDECVNGDEGSHRSAVSLWDVFVPPGVGSVYKWGVKLAMMSAGLDPETGKAIPNPCSPKSEKPSDDEEDGDDDSDSGSDDDDDDDTDIIDTDLDLDLDKDDDDDDDTIIDGGSDMGGSGGPGRSGPPVPPPGPGAGGNGGSDPTPTQKPTPDPTASQSSSSCSKTVTVTDHCELECTKVVAPLSTGTGYTTETDCPTSATCTPTVVCDTLEPTTTTSYTTRTEEPTGACYARREDIYTRLTGYKDDAKRPANATEPAKKTKREGLPHLYTWERLPGPDGPGNTHDWFSEWRRQVNIRGVGAAFISAGQYWDDALAPNHAVYQDFGDIPFGGGVPNIAGCSVLVVASPHGVYLAHFYEVPTFAAPAPGTFSQDPGYDYTDRKQTWRERVTSFLSQGNYRQTFDAAGNSVPDFNAPASPSLRQLVTAPDGPFHDLLNMEWNYIAIIGPGLPGPHSRPVQKHDTGRLFKREVREVLHTPTMGADASVIPNGAVEEIRYLSDSTSWDNPEFAASPEAYFKENPSKNLLIMQYGPALGDLNYPDAIHHRGMRIWFDGKVIFQKAWCTPMPAERRPKPANLPDLTDLINPPWLDNPIDLDGPEFLRLAARQEEGESDALEMDAPSCPIRPWRVCALDVAQTVIPTMNPRIEGTIDVTDEMGYRAHIEDFKDVPFGGFVTSEPEDNNLGYNVTMRFDGDWDKYLINKGYSCNCTDSGCDLYSAKCCDRGDCPTCSDCSDGVCPAGSPECCSDNSCNATRPENPKDYPFLAWDVKVFIEGEKGALGDDAAWVKNVTCSSSGWGQLNETLVDGYCMPVSLHAPRRTLTLERLRTDVYLIDSTGSSSALGRATTTTETATRTPSTG